MIAIIFFCSIFHSDLCLSFVCWLCHVLLLIILFNGFFVVVVLSVCAAVFDIVFIAVVCFHFSVICLFSQRLFYSIAVDLQTRRQSIHNLNLYEMRWWFLDHIGLWFGPNGKKCLQQHILCAIFVQIYLINDCTSIEILKL